jgi:hypothetical protein
MTADTPEKPEWVKRVIQYLFEMTQRQIRMDARSSNPRCG